MSDAKRNAELWRLLARVRELRLERRRRALNAARDGLHQADARLEQRREEIRRHDAQRESILQSCGHDKRGGRLWREALRWHDERTPELHRALAFAIRERSAAADQVTKASTQLQRETIGRDDALERARRFKAALLDRD
ncbi:hypothetical protein [Paraburkholderia sp. SOS3]|jgi:hypothetical protein|uniref:hypothetical protein n=1 Tax=Paraburkholderia sp. SOS3 TaxID=1926494 RepID=UPI0009473677|nr:hypothetical protein [Paraburkholderia sp. SOS3]APR37357.1 hypothetical protein BTO02_02125 [Paraburkholderia sp. SOS3]